MSGHNNDENHEQETWFAGRERSGISVQNLASGRHGPGGFRAGSAGSRPNFFTDGGHMLGEEGTSSVCVPGGQGGGGGLSSGSFFLRLTHSPTVRLAPFPALDWFITRTLQPRDPPPHLLVVRPHGPLMRYDDPANADVLAAINAGHAPPSILNLCYGQRFDVQVTQRTSDDYVPPPPKPFSGSSNRLGAPVRRLFHMIYYRSGICSDGEWPVETHLQGQQSLLGAVDKKLANPNGGVDQTQPTTSVPIRLADGTRIFCRMNLTHTLRDLRNFINGSPLPVPPLSIHFLCNSEALPPPSLFHPPFCSTLYLIIIYIVLTPVLPSARPENLTRHYTIGTAFLNRTLDNSAATIKEAECRCAAVGVGCKRVGVYADGTPTRWSEVLVFRHPARNPTRQLDTVCAMFVWGSPNARDHARHLEGPYGTSLARQHDAPPPLTNDAGAFRHRKVARAWSPHRRRPALPARLADCCAHIRPLSPPFSREAIHIADERFLRSPAARDRSKSLSVNHFAASSFAFHHANISNSLSTVSGTRFIQISKAKDREREWQCIREVERGGLPPVTHARACAQPVSLPYSPHPTQVATHKSNSCVRASEKRAANLSFPSFTLPPQSAYGPTHTFGEPETSQAFCSPSGPRLALDSRRIIRSPW
ncbi:hypothetical protein K438DRAFT_1985917 [Mycena galopus ATCC 62051]|nr:hypothetical protein K438DRAFT_1985917 [Mycena galopus ATCC 62051]